MDKIDIEVNIPGVDDSITSVKELRAKINELKDSLVTLEAGTEEYNSVVKELQASTSKLNEVNQAAKASADALPGSYNAINNEMKALIQEYKNMAIVTDEDRQKQAELGKQINALNDELKRQDAAIGNYQRNVGNYKEAFEGLRQVMDIAHTGAEQLGDGFAAVGSIIQSSTGQVSTASSAFSALGATFEGITGVAYSLYDSIDKVNIAYQLGGEVMDLFKTKQAAATAATEADSVAKKANTVATTAETTATNAATVATKGLTKALLTNPFTLIAVAVVALIANLDVLVKAFHSVMDWITGANEKLAENERITNNVIAANDKLIASQEQRSKEFEREVRIMKAQGASAQAIIKARMKENLANRQALKDQIALTQARYNDVKALAAQDPEKYGKQLEALAKVIKENWKLYRGYQESYKNLTTDLKVQQIEDAKTAKNAAASKAKSHADAQKKIREEAQKTKEELQKAYEDDVKNFVKSCNEKIKANQQLLQTYDSALSYIKRIDTLNNESYSNFLKNTNEESNVYKAVEGMRLNEAKKISDELSDYYAQETERMETEYNERQRIIKENSKITEKEREKQLADLDEEYSKALRSINVNFAKIREDAIGKNNASILDSIVGTDGQSTLQILDEAQKKMDNFKNALEKINKAYSAGTISEQDYIDEIRKLKEVLKQDVSTIDTSKLNSPMKEAVEQLLTLTPEDEQVIGDNLSNAGQKILDNFMKSLNEGANTDSPGKELDKSSLVLQAFGLGKPEDMDTQTQDIITKLTEQKNKLKEFMESDDYKLLTPEQQGEVMQQLTDTNAQIIEESNKRIQENAKKTVDTIKGIYSGVMSGLSGLGDLFQAKMDLAKTKADKIKKDTTLTEEQQAKLLEEQQKEYNKAFEANKKIQIAQTTISTLQSAMEAYKAMAGIPYVGPILGAAAASAALATGFIQIKQIKATTPDSLSDSSSSSSSSSSVTNTIDVNSLLNSDRESSELNSDYLTELQGNKSSNSKVYVVEQDITQTQNKAKVQVSQSTF